MAQVSLKNIRKSFGSVQVINGIDLEITKGEFIVFVGPSGCGKSTILRMISGLEDVSAGHIHIDGCDVTHVPPSKRELAMVFQSYALFPHLSVGDNIGFGLKLAGVPRSEISRRVLEVAKTLQLETLLDRMPRQLSGGQRQRVAIGRSIIRDPKVFLFDEPLSNLDAALRVQMRLEIARLHSSLPGTTMIYVTHDQTEAMTLADRIVVFNSGNIEQVGTPMELYNNPANTFVATFIGAPSMNLIDGEVLEDGTLKVGDALIRNTGIKGHSGARKIGIRPEHISIANNKNADFTAEIEIIERLGAELLLYLKVPFKNDPLTLRADAGANYNSGDLVDICINRDHLHVFDDAN